MIGLLIHFLILLIVVGVIYAVLVRLLPEWSDIIRLVCGAVIVIALLYLLLGVAGGPYSLGRI